MATVLGETRDEKSSLVLSVQNHHIFSFGGYYCNIHNCEHFKWGGIFLLSLRPKPEVHV
ncbi:unnamed protein product, partial [Allacma fusca]